MISQPKPTQEPETYLRKPIGPFGVGHNDTYVTDNSRCPDPICAAVDPTHPNCDRDDDAHHPNPKDFTKDNPNRCHGVGMRVYYPTKKSVQLSDLYYPPITRDFQRQLNVTQAKIPSLTDGMIAQVGKIRSYSTEGAPIMSGKFPVIFVGPGSGCPSQLYENVITELVSRGNIVVGLSSTFINMVALPDKSDYQHVVQPVAIDDEGVSHNQQRQDILYIYKNLSKLPMFSSMDGTRIAAMGHSLGASVLADIAHDYPNLFKIFMTLELGRSFPSSEIAAIVKVPYLAIVAANRRDPRSFQFENRNQTRIRLAPSDKDHRYTAHNSVSDEGTLQYQPALKLFEEYEIQQGNPVLLGYGDGWLVADAIAANVGNFVDHHFHGKSVPEFDKCIPLVPSITTVCCGPGFCNTTFDPTPIFSQNRNIVSTPVIQPIASSIPKISNQQISSTNPVNIIIPPEIPPVTSGASRIEPLAPFHWLANSCKVVGNFFGRFFSHSSSINQNRSTGLVLAADHPKQTYFSTDVPLQSPDLSAADKYITFVDFGIRILQHYFTLPWNREHLLSDGEKKHLTEIKSSITRFADLLSEQISTNAAGSGLFHDEFEYIQRNLPELESKINGILKTGKVARPEISDIDSKIYRIENFSKVITEANNELERLAAEEKHLLKSQPDAINTTCFEVHRDFDGKITWKFSPLTEAVREKAKQVEQAKLTTKQDFPRNLPSCSFWQRDEQRLPALPAAPRIEALPGLSL